MKEEKPYIPASTKLPETTVKGILLGVILSAVLAGANAYLGLFAGLTVSASIPAAVISMAVLRLFRKSNILENNAVQTAASAGESLAAGVIFTFPALVLMGYWTEFNYWETTLIALCGGVLGVLFTIPLRRALIVEQKLQFPEGVATSEVLKSGEEGGKAVVYLVWAAIIGAVLKLGESAFKLWEGIFDWAAIWGGKVYTYFGMNLSPALIAVGYIVGLNIAILVFMGGAISWWIAIPSIIAIQGNPDGTDPVALGYKIWSTQIRYIGVGAMVVGGLWALLSLRGSIVSAVRQGIDAFKDRKNAVKNVLRTEQDTPMSWVIIGVGIMILPVLFIYLREIEVFGISAFMTVLMIVAGFLFSAVAGYMAGLVGSSNNPISGVTIATILTTSLLLLALMGAGPKGPAAAILIGAVVCCAAAIAGDNMQDLKAGHILGATPRRQQIMQMVGVIGAAAVIAPVLTLLNSAYGFGPATAANPSALAAPQATLMASVAQGVFGGNLPWDFVGIGAGVAVLIIAIDQYLKKRDSKFRMPILAVAIGIYLPFELDSAIMLGGVIAYLVSRTYKNNKGANFAAKKQASERTGLLFASGLITGEALIGIAIAIPIAISGDLNIMKLIDEPMGSLPGVLLVGAVCFALYYFAKKAFKTA